MIRFGTAEDKAAICHHLALAFQNRTFLAYLVDRTPDPKAALEEYFQVMWDVCPLKWISDSKDAAAMWYPPEYSDRFGDNMRAAWALFRHDPIRFRVGVLVKRAKAKLRPATPYYYLSVLGVSPESQKCGMGKALLDAGLRLCDEKGVGAFLETGNPDNIKYYEDFGFVLMQKVELGRGIAPFWTMFRSNRR